MGLSEGLEMGRLFRVIWAGPKCKREARRANGGRRSDDRRKQLELCEEGPQARKGGRAGPRRFWKGQGDRSPSEDSRRNATVQTTH